MKILPCAVGASIMQLAAAASAQSSTPSAASPCSSTEYRQLDFWVGDWALAWTNPDGTDGEGRNVITKGEYGSCVITERFEAADSSLIGLSISTYLRGPKQWRQTWMDNQGGFFDLAGGPVSASDHIFALENKRIREGQPFQRMIWQDVKADSLTWRWQRRAKDSDPWTDTFVVRYRRNVTPSK